MTDILSLIQTEGQKLYKSITELEKKVAYYTQQINDIQLELTDIQNKREALKKAKRGF